MSPNPEQQKIIAHVTGSTATDTLVIAGPGSGKTRTLVGCIESLVENDVPADKLVAISFTNNSAAELKVRLAKLAGDHVMPALHRVHVSTFHAWVGQLQALHIEPWSHPPIGLKSASLAVALDLKNPDSVKHHFSKSEISAADRHMDGCETFTAMEERNFNLIQAGGKNSEGFKKLKTAVADLEPEIKDQQIGTFGTQMKAGIDLAATLKLGEVSWLFIDEAQDMNATQAAFVDAVQKATGCKVFVIADDDQGIYKFRGASNAFLNEFGGRTSTRTFALSQNFRSTKTIVDACVNWITPNWDELGTPPKTLFSERKGLPIAILNNSNADARSRHAKIIIDACKKVKLIKNYGEAAILGLSASPGFELDGCEIDLHAISDQGLPQEILDALIDKLKDSLATGEWHHGLWQEFLSEVTANQKGDAQLGYPGLNDLYAALEVIRRLHPDYSPREVGKIFKNTTCGFEDGKAQNYVDFAFMGSRPDPDYKGDKVNYLSFHSSKGMEFPVVWLTGAPYTFAPKPNDASEGQPNVMGELGEWAKKVGKAFKSIIGKEREIDEAKLNKIATNMENRRLLYVAMSRASDLLMISVPKDEENPYNDWRKQENERRCNYRASMNEAFRGKVDFKPITTDDQARTYARLITTNHRNRHWEAPKRYRLESYTSLSNQVMPGEVREVEIPRDREYPCPPSEAAIVGDQFHRIMHLLCLEPDLIDQYLCCGGEEDVIARVTTDTGSSRLRELVTLYFGDSKNKPYETLKTGNCRSELPFTMLTEDATTKEEILVKGFLDLVQFDADGNPILILDYKTGARTKDESSHIEQLELYQKALAQNHSVEPETISLVNYYVDTQAWVVRSPAP